LGWLATSCLLASLQTVCGQDASPKPPRIAVVRLASVFSQSPQQKAMEAAFTEERAKKLEIIKEKRKEVKKLEDEVDLFDLGTDARKRVEERLFKKQVEYETYARLAQQEWDRKRVYYTAKLYREIRGHIAEYAKRNGFDLVLKLDAEDLEENNMELLQLQMKLRTVLYAVSTIDITDKVIAYLETLAK